MPDFDTIILGLGAMGSAAAWACASSRPSMCLDSNSFALSTIMAVHTATAGLFEKAYFEHPAYVPLVQEAFDRWNDLEIQVGQSLLTHCACVNIGPPGCEIIEGVLQGS